MNEPLTQHEVAMAVDQAQVLKSARRVTQLLNNELAKLGPSGRRSLCCGVHEGLARRIAEDDNATRADQQRKMLALSRGVLKGNNLTPEKEGSD